MDDCNNPHYKLAKSVYDFKARLNNGEVVPLRQYEGCVTIFVNFATKCKFTEHMFDLLVDAYDAFEDKGLRIAAFPCNQFSGLEPGSREELRQFLTEFGARYNLYDKIDVNGCDHMFCGCLRIAAFPCNQFSGLEPGTREELRQFFTEVGARFDLYDKVDVNGCETTHQLYRYMKRHLPDERTNLGVIKNNYTLFIFDKKGLRVTRLEPPVEKEVLFKLMTDYLGDPLPTTPREKIVHRSWHIKKDDISEEVNQKISATSKMSATSKISATQKMSVSLQELQENVEAGAQIAPNYRKSVQIQSKPNLDLNLQPLGEGGDPV